MSPDLTETINIHGYEEPPRFEVNIVTHEIRWNDAIPNNNLLINHAVQNLMSNEHCFDGAMVAIVLSNDAEISTLNNDFRHKNTPTNVLSFPDGEEGALGDIILSLDTLVRESREQHKELSHHVIHMLTHGVLHLLGHDHKDDDEAALMEAREIAFLKTLNISNPYSEV